ncbi:hypothetical protein [Alcanivorax jadensis]|uniref:hypothetical protein n=1 Tax=Alcanivorax jadensis TaxID=64988 RepID=UPI0012EC46C8|nr:hypothetical protein [Alcanivorax jadensis]
MTMPWQGSFAKRAAMVILVADTKKTMPESVRRALKLDFFTSAAATIKLVFL